MKMDLALITYNQTKTIKSILSDLVKKQQITKKNKEFHIFMNIIKLCKFFIPVLTGCFFIELGMKAILVEFYGISTLVGYLIPNPVFTYTLNI